MTRQINSAHSMSVGRETNHFSRYSTQLKCHKAYYCVNNHCVNLISLPMQTHNEVNILW